jgi:catechol 2,3-dioxygenase-like lactoylglutathione lyase family enzyme
MTDGQPAITGIHHFPATVRNVEASVDWYQRVVGLERVPGTFRTTRGKRLATRCL